MRLPEEIFSRFKPFTVNHLDWALRQMKRAGDPAERRELEDRFFAEVKLEDLLYVAPHWTKSDLLRLLSPERFADSVSWLASAWENLPDEDQCRAGEILAEIAPETAAERFQSRAEAWDPASDDPEVWRSILVQLPNLPPAAAEPIARKALMALQDCEKPPAGSTLSQLARAAAQWAPEFLDSRVAEFLRNGGLEGPESIEDVAAVAEALSIDRSAVLRVGNELEAEPETPIHLPPEIFPEGEWRAAVVESIQSMRENDPETALRKMRARQDRLAEFRLPAQFPPEAEAHVWIQAHPAGAKALLALCAAALLTRLKRLETGLPALSTQALLEIIGVDSPFIPDRDAVMAELARRPPAEIATGWARVMGAREEAFYALDHLLEVAAELGIPELAVPLCGLLDIHPEYASLSPLPVDAGRGVGAPLRQAIAARFPRLNEAGREGAVSMISGMPPAEIDAFVLSHWAELWKQDRRLVLELADLAVSEACLDRIHPHAGKDQSDIDRTFVLLAELLGRDFPELDDARKTVFQSEAQNRRVSEALRNQDPQDLFAIPSFRLFLRCPDCGAVNEYSVNRVILLQDSKQFFFIPQEFACLDCGKIGGMELTDSATRFLQAMTFFMAVLPEEGKERVLKNSVFDFQTLRVFDKTYPVPEGLEAYEAAIRKTPDNVGLRIGFANVLVQLGRRARAEGVYRNALETDPRFIQAHFGLATLAAKAGDPRKAFDWLEEGRRHWEEAQMFTGFSNAHRADMLEAFLEDYCKFYNETAKELELNVPRLRPPADPIRKADTGKKKVGRNDPCPCGSGKKHKKCCLRRKGTA